MNGTLAVILALYLLGLLALSVFASRRISNEEDYVVAGRKLPLWLAWGTLLATWFGAATMLGAAEAARSAGVRATVLDPFASGIALIIAGVCFARPLWDMKLLTMGDFYGRVYGKRAELLASCVLVPGYFGWIGAQFVALGGLQETFFDIPADWGILIGAVFILVYTLFGGMWSVTLTDTLQLAVLLVGVVVLGHSVFSHLGDGAAVDGIGVVFRQTEPEFLTLLPEAGLVASLAWTATLCSGFFGNVPGQDLMQRVFSCRDAPTAQRACVLAGVVYLTFGLIPVGIGLASRILVPDDADGAILGILARQFLTPTLTAVFVVSLVSIIISTATSAVLAPATILGHNLLGRLPVFTTRKLLIERLAVVITVTGGVVMAFSGDTILGLLETSLATVLVGLFVPLVMGLYGKPRGEISGLLSIACGAVAWLGRELLEGLWLPMDASAAESGVRYPDFVAAEFPGVVGQALFAIVVFPSAIVGVVASFVGYFGGQFILRSREAP
ncbi:MAG: sodium:solute symporter family protein [Planctomycetota bacterium]|nr:sodium:solute symporter family protein [Planctomycetota bacterium]